MGTSSSVRKVEAFTMSLSPKFFRTPKAWDNILGRKKMWIFKDELGRQVGAGERPLPTELKTFSSPSPLFPGQGTSQFGNSWVLFTKQLLASTSQTSGGLISQ